MLPHSVDPLGHTHAPQPHAALQVCVPVPSQLCVALGAQAPCPVHADQPDHVPLLQVRACVPQLPQACEEGPAHVHWLFWHDVPLAHAWPHVPQLLASLVVSTQAPEHAA